MILQLSSQKITLSILCSRAHSGFVSTPSEIVDLAAIRGAADENLTATEPTQNVRKTVIDPGGLFNVPIPGRQNTHTTSAPTSASGYLLAMRPDQK